MTQPEVMQKAAALFAEYKEGDEFIGRRISDGAEESIPLKHIMDYLTDDEWTVRLKPKPVRRLKKAWDILEYGWENNKVAVDAGAHIIWVDGVDFYWVNFASENYVPGGKTTEGWPDWMFEPETPAPPVDRIAQMAQTISDRFWKESTEPYGFDERKQLESLIREECDRRNIT